MATPFVAGNWKMNPPSVTAATALADGLRGPLSGVGGVTRVVCPPFIALPGVAQALEGADIGVGAQNVHPEPKGAFTGEVSVSMLQDLCSYVILGHSERRQLFAEEDAFINAKLHAALQAGLTPILCVGETLDEREAGQANAVVERQLTGGLAGLDADAVVQVVIAYEPVWAIGTGRSATPQMAQEMAGAVRYEIARLSHISTAGQVPILYGGSVNAANAAELAAQEDIDGALVGGASLEVDPFVAIAQAFAARAG